MARKWGEDNGGKTVLDYSQKDNEEAAGDKRLDFHEPMADLSLKSRVDEFEDNEEGMELLHLLHKMRGPLQRLYHSFRDMVIDPIMAVGYTYERKGLWVCASIPKHEKAQKRHAY